MKIDEVQNPDKLYSHYIMSEIRELKNSKVALLNAMNDMRKTNNVSSAASIEMSIGHLDQAIRRLNIALKDTGKDLS